MILHHVYYELAILGLLWLCIILHSLWPSRGALSPRPPAAPVPPKCKHKRANAPHSFEGLLKKPHCTACEQCAQPRPASTATRADAANQPTPMCHRHLEAFLSACGL